MTTIEAKHIQMLNGKIDALTKQNAKLIEALKAAERIVFNAKVQDALQWETDPEKTHDWAMTHPNVVEIRQAIKESE